MAVLAIESSTNLREHKENKYLTRFKTLTKLVNRLVGVKANAGSFNVRG